MNERIIFLVEGEQNLVKVSDSDLTLTRFFGTYSYIHTRRDPVTFI